MSLWIANGGVAGATTVTVNGGTDKYVYNGTINDTSAWTAKPTGERTDYHTIINGGTVNKQTYGGYSKEGDVTSNSVTATNATLKGDVLGGSSKNGAADHNEVTITGSTVTGYINGGSGTTSASHNTVTLTRTTVKEHVYGGMATDGNPTINNTVSLTDSTILDSDKGVFGGTNNTTFTGNTLNLSGKNTAGSVGHFDTVKIKSATWGTPVMTAEDFFSITNIDASGLEFTNPEAASGSTTLLSMTTAGTSTESGLDKPMLTVTSRTQNYTDAPLIPGVTINGTLKGNITKSASAVTYTLTSNEVNKLTFGNVTWKDSDALYTRPTHITFAGANVDTSNINFTNIQSLAANKKMTLVANFDGNGSETFTGTKYKVGSTLQGEGKASLVDSDGDGTKDALIFTAETAVAPPPAPTPSPTPSSDDSSSSNSNSTNNNKNTNKNTNTNKNSNTNTNTTNNNTNNSTNTNNTNKNSNSSGSGGGELVLEVQEQTHNTVMGAMAGMAALSAGNDFIGAATDGLALASNVGADGISSYANMGGGNMRQETGSHVDTHTWNAIIALGHKNEKERGSLEYGAFFEYGTGNYTTFNGNERGDGSSHYTGGGVLAKWTANHGLYVEGSLRAGRVHDDARNVLRDASGMPYSYTTNANYFGFHVGVGKEIAFDDIHTLDVYGKFFYNRRNGVSFDAGGHYDLDAVTSKIVRVGARYTIKSEKWDIYAGAAYEHEMDGKASGKADGLSIRGADTSGGSFRGELGATVTPDKNVPVKLDFNLTGFAGKKRGFSGGVSVAFMF